MDNQLRVDGTYVSRRRQSGFATFVLVAFACAVALVAGLFAGPAVARADEQQVGSFTLAVINGDGTGYLVEPMQVGYADGQTLEDVLEASGQGFTFSGGFVTRIKGADVSTTCRVYYTGGWRDGIGYDVPADEVTAVLFTTNAATATLTEDHTDLLVQMGAYLTAMGNVRNYPKATAAYQAAYQGIVSADGSEAGRLYSDLKGAMDEYQSIVDGVTYAVNVTVTRGGLPVSGAQATLTDAYGNVTPVEGGSARVVAGSYTLEASIEDGLWAVQKSIDVSASNDGQTVAVDLPTADWFGSVELLDGKGAEKVPVRQTGSLASRFLTFYVPDYITELNCLFAVPQASDAVPTGDDRYSVQARYKSLATGDEYVNRLAFGSRSHNLDYMLAAGMQGADLTFEMRFQADDSTVQIERCRATAVRTPTLKSLSVMQDTTELLAGFDSFRVVDGRHSDEYAVNVTAGELTFSAAAFDAECQVSVDGRPLDASGTAVVQVPQGASTVPVTVTQPGGETTTYTIDVSRADATQVTLAHEAGVDVQVLNAAGGVVEPESATDTQAAYQLFPGDTYSYVSTKDTYYHATNTFVANAGATVSAATPLEEQIVDNLELKRNVLQRTSASYCGFQRESGQGDDHTYVFDVPDTDTMAYARIDTVDSAWVGVSPYFSVDGSWNSALTGAPQTLAWETTTQSGTQRSWNNVDELGFARTPALFNGSDAYDKENDGKRYKTYDLNADGETYTYNTTGTGEYVSYHDKTCVHARLSSFITKGANGNTAHLKVTSGRSDTAGTTYYQDFTIKVNRISSLATLRVDAGKAPLRLTQTASLASGSPVNAFSGTVDEYTIDVPAGSTVVNLTFRFIEPLRQYKDTGLVGGYSATVSGGDPAQVDYSATTAQTISVPLDPNETDSEDISLAVSNQAEGSVARTYVVHVIKHPPINLAVNVTPADATISLIDTSNNSRVWPAEDGTYPLVEGSTYRWTAGAMGYIGKSDQLTAYKGTSGLDITLERAKPNTKLDASMTGFWPSFRLGEDNVSSVDAPTPTLSSQTVLYWAATLGQGFDSSAAGCPILVDGYLYSYGSAAGQAMIYKLDATTGETVAQNTMVGASSFSLTPLTYADGMLFVALAGGKVEAFDAQTLESLWVYTDPLGGQPNCPVTYHDGYVYTGFWNGYTDKWGNFVCLTATDEHPDVPGHEKKLVGGRETTVPADTKQALWTHTTEGGYYWAGAVARDNYVLMGADDGLADSDNPDGTGVLYSFDPKTGRVIDTLKGTDTMPFTGDVRTQITYDEQTGYYYFMTKNGYLNRMKVNDDGTFVKGSFSRLDLSQSTAIGVGMCTSTPAIYNGRAYVGVSGDGQFKDYSGHHLAVVDLASFSVVYTVETKGYVQATPLISTHYAGDASTDGDGYAYVYMIENCQPGQVRIIRDKPGMTAPDEWSLQDEVCGKTEADPVRKLARKLFSPTGEEAQYAICSPICDEDGFIYFKNDSGRMMCIGPTMTSLEVIKLPDRTTYARGEVFDPTGMQVVAHYSNGVTRDVSKYVTCSTSPLTAMDRSMTVRFEHTKYQNTSDYTNASYRAPVDYQAPTTSVPITVGEQAAPTITTKTLPAGYAGNTISPASHYSATLSASSYPAVSAWKLVDGSLPAGLALDESTGVISGTPGEAGSFAFSVTATNDNGTSEARELAIDIRKPPEITFPTHDAELSVEGVVGSALARPYHLAASGFPSPGWRIYLGALPDGLTLDADTGEITGTPSKAGTYVAMFTADNGVWPSARTQAVTFRITDPARLAVTTSTLPAGQVDQEYSARLGCNATLGTTWSVTAGTLPDGLALDPDTGAITGTPTETGDFRFTVTVSVPWGASASRDLSIEVNPAGSGEAPTILTSVLPDATAGQTYSAALEAAGDPTPGISVVGLPAGLAIAGDDHGTATIAGTPETAGTYEVVVTADNGVGQPATVTLTLTVAKAPVSSRVERLAGAPADGAAGTAAAIAAEAFAGSTADTVVIARNDDYHDALAGAGLAGALNAPILLTDRGGLSQAAADEISGLGATRAVILGGPSAITPQVEADLADLGLEVDRLGGADVYGTSMAVNERLVSMGGADADQAIVVNPTTFADALSISGWAYANKVPVMLQTWGDTAAERGFDDEAKAILQGRHLVVCGGEQAVSSASAEGLDPGFERLGGETIYDTSLAIAGWELEHGMSAKDVTVASAIPDYNGVDALAGSALAGRAGGVTLLAQSNGGFGWYDGGESAIGFVRAHASEVQRVHVLGGEVASTPTLYDAIKEALGEA